VCGIIGYIGPRSAVDVLLHGLERLEYRGYDSAGLALIGRDNTLQVRRSQGKLTKLRERLQAEPCDGSIGVGHTRWATHGVPSDTNAHPHRVGRTVVVHNGIIENYVQLKQELGLSRSEYASQTDTEIIAHLVDRYVLEEGDFVCGACKALKKLKGSYAVVLLHSDYPTAMLASRNESPLVLGLGDGEFFVASDVPAFMNYTREVVFIDDGDLVYITGGNAAYMDLEGRPVTRGSVTLQWSPVMAEKTGFSHFMEKEIFEQPRALVDTLRGRFNPETGAVFLDDCGLEPDLWSRVRRVVIVACGTSYHAGIVAKFWIERLARLPVEVDLGSEFRYRNAIIRGDDLLVAVSQSGETADTLAAVREARQKGAWCLAVCNAVGSSLTRECHGVCYTHAGPEIGVASTKAFTTQLALLYIIALRLAQAVGTVSLEAAVSRLSRLVQLPGRVGDILATTDIVRQVAAKYFQASDFLYLGRGLLYPIALEGALKLKEISYIHAEGYPAGEMKHGPIALIDERLPVVALVSPDTVYDKMLSNIEEVRARGGIVIAVAREGSSDVFEMAQDVIPLPASLGELDPILWVVPLQLLAYHIAVLRGTDVDQPRNLAKSVTVE